MLTTSLEEVVLVDTWDRQVGVSEKLEAHENGLLHRAFSVFIFNTSGELMLQKRNSRKYHSGGLWTNTACGHPRPGEPVREAAHRRLFEEMGIRCQVYKEFDFIYKVDFDNGLTEYEFDHVFVGKHPSYPSPNPIEVEDWKWVSWKEIMEDIKVSPDQYTFWFKLCLEEFEKRDYQVNL